DMWLAPAMSILTGLWASLNLSALCPPRARWFIPAGLLITPFLATLYPAVNALFRIPLEQVIHGGYPWALLLAVELAAALAGPWLIFIRATGSRGLRCTRRLVAWQVFFWLFFLACMVIGLLPAVNPPTSDPLRAAERTQAYTGGDPPRQAIFP
ncbi:MAG: hypothetical protein JXA20_19065, partial [Spirochaetes bacterium]|nr:hypothetical protein [Spirochaetota bacterium]